MTDLDTRSYFLKGTRLAFGAWLLYIGAMKWIGGAAGFVGYISSDFAATWLPPVLTTAAAWVIILAEPLVGGWLLTGRKQRLAWLSAAALMFLLAFGKTVTQDFATVANNWQYLVLCLVAGAWTKPGE